MSKEKLLSINERLVQQLEHNMQTLSELNQEILERDQKMMSNERELKTREKQVLSLKVKLQTYFRTDLKRCRSHGRRYWSKVCKDTG